MKVLAVKGIKVPKEDKPREYITETPPEGEQAFEVPESAYYLRRVSDGDLVIVKPKKGA
ncbi:DUF2635 domain-containing protein [Sideroxydans lithotrophicus]|uniref:DUF2635 domain-containing protein n=1 Tax=Sideroxydans lithotrophicus (strain ES-1) TaxID=580332 RepID=D5CUE1_SIDLE|nr:DUF2635 domain-containing protein [Sideroxydans lithotrophicus]ADE10476.1 conserved hypothetical protein [Sideroxydans lithotrophicus ES-1]